MVSGLPRRETLSRLRMAIFLFGERALLRTGGCGVRILVGLGPVSYVAC
jgi:hypothetical protein